MPTTYSPTTKRQVMRAHRDGETNEYIATIMEMSPRSVGRIIREMSQYDYNDEYEMYEVVAYPKVNGKPRFVYKIDNDSVVVLDTLTDYSRHWDANNGMQTVRRYIFENDASDFILEYVLNEF